MIEFLTPYTFSGRRWAGGLVLLAWLLLPLAGRAQTAASYTFSQATGAAYSPITGGTVLGTATNDDNNFNALTIGFSFSYVGSSFTAFSVNANGWLRMGSAISSSYVSLATYTTAIAALNRDLQGSTANASELRYQTIGTAPNRQLVVQWQGYRRYANTGTDNLNFQIILSETTNTVQFAYGSNVIGGSASDLTAPQVGINGTAVADFNNRTSTTDWTATTAGTANTATIGLSAVVVPPSGLAYTFAPPCTGTPAAGVAVVTSALSCAGPNVTIGLSGGAANAAGISYQLQSSATSGGTYASVGAASANSSFTITTATAYYRILTTCTNSSLFATSTPVLVAGTTYATLPYIQGFENAWASPCGTRDAPDANWRAYPPTGNKAWRRYEDGAAGGWSSTNGYYTPAGSNAGGASSGYSARFHSYDVTAGTTGQLDLAANVSGGTGTPVLAFDYINTTGADGLEVLLSTDGGATFSATPLFSQGLAAGWATYAMPLTGATATSIIRFRATGDEGLSDIGLDNVSVSYVNCAPVTALAVSSITATTASISFTAPIGGATGYTVTYTPAGGAATTVMPAPTASPVALTGLMPGTTYAVSVVTNCPGSFAPTAATTTFSTSYTCGTPTYASLPYTQSFESFTANCDQRDVPGPNWRNTPATGNASFRRYDHGVTANWTSNNGYYTPAGSNAGGASSGYSARFHSADATAGATGLFDLYLNASGTGTATLTFDYLNTSGSDKIDVLLSTDGGATFGPVLFSQVLATSWTTYAVPLPGATATSVVRFRATSDQGTTDIGLDNVGATLIITPANDACANAVVLTPGSTCTPVSGTVAGATQSLAAITCGAATPAATPVADVWYQFTAAAPQSTVSIVGSFDGVLDVRTGSCATSTNIDCSDATGNNETRTLATTIGTTYFVRYYPAVANPANGTFTICVTQLNDLVVDGTNSPYTASGAYNNVTINNNGTASLGADLTVNGTLVINSGGVLNTAGSQVLGTGNFTLLAGGTLGIRSADGISATPAATGAIRNTGGIRSFSTDASYVYNGTAAQTTGTALPATVRALTTTNANAVTLTAPVSVMQTVTVAGAGNLALGGNALTLLSSSTGTALVVNAGTGIVSGSTGVAQRYLDGALNPGMGYRHYSAPVSGSTVADLATSGFAPEVSQASTYNSSATPGQVTPFPTVFGYDQSRLATVASNYSAFDKGWAVPAGPGTPLAVGQGYSVQIAASPLVDFTGTFVTGNQTLALARNSGATAADAGWALVGNPYPAPLDWSQVVAGTDRTGLDASIYVFQSAGPYTGSYRSYANGVGGNPVVPMGQGFFVRVSTGQTSGSLTFRNSHRLITPDATAVRRPTADPRPLVQLDLRGAGFADAFYAYAEAGATAGFDSQYDARKLPNSTGLNLASVVPVGESLAIDGRPAFTAATSITLTVGVPAAGTYSLGAATLANLPAGLEAYLTDAATGQTVPLSQGSYSFSLTTAQAASLITGRFTLHFSARAVLATTTALTAAEVSVYPNPAHESFTVLMPAVASATSVQAELLNALGQVVRKQLVALPAVGACFIISTVDLATGVYTLRLQAGRSMLTKRVVKAE